jgi:hypothetical protein
MGADGLVSLLVAPLDTVHDTMAVEMLQGGAGLTVSTTHMSALTGLKYA